jgi:putative Mg2+ transporter-C (MgtC) family protein
MTQEEIVILIRVTAALVVGAAIGFERTFHGRPAGFRTHALVCLASSLLMLVTVSILVLRAAPPGGVLRAPFADL